MPEPSVAFSYAKSNSYIAFLLDDVEFTRFTYSKQSNSVDLTARSAIVLTPASLRTFLDECAHFIANIHNRFKPKKDLAGDCVCSIEFEVVPRRVVLDNVQAGLAYRVEYAGHAFSFAARTASTLPWGDFLHFIHWHEMLYEYVG